MKIAVVGPGALGCLVAASLKNRTKEDVWLFDHHSDRAKKLTLDGIRVEGIGASFSAKVPVMTDAPALGRCDLVIICVKSYSTEDACKDIKALVSAGTSVLTLQNGIGNIQVLDDHFGSEKVIGGVTNHGATLLGAGHVRHSGKGDTVIGRSDGRVIGAVREISNVLTKAGFDTRVSKDIDSVIWSKLVINVGINALSAVTRLNNGMLIEHSDCRGLLRLAVGEAIKVVKRKRIKLLYDDPVQKVESVCRATAQNVSSMLQDILQKRRTEIDFINGAIVRQAKPLNIPTPVNDALTGLVKTLEVSYDKSVEKA